MPAALVSGSPGLSFPALRILDSEHFLQVCSVLK